MTDTYALTVTVEAYEYDGEFYLVGGGYETPADVFEHVAADHIRAIKEWRARRAPLTSDGQMVVSRSLESSADCPRATCHQYVVL